MTAVDTAAGPRAAAPASRAAVFGWILFDWAQQPFFTLVTTFVFAPYFAARFIEDPARGQALWGLGVGLAGLLIAILSPILGAVADAGGRHKTWVLGFGALQVAGSVALWLAAPGTAESTAALVLAAFVVASIGAEFAIVFTNAMMPDLVPPERLGRLSGTAWAVGYLGGLASLVLVLGFMAADPASGRTVLGLAPILGLDPAAAEGDRAVGPLSALWFAAFALPFFLFAPNPPAKRPLRAALRQGLSGLADALRRARRHRNVLLFLLAHMVYADGLGALFAFGGVYAAGVFGWATLQIGLFGILLTVAGTLGAFLGGRLDDRLGPRRVVLGALLLLMTACALILTVDRTHVLLVVPVAPAGSGLFASAGEKLYIALGLAIGLAAGPLQSASRTLLARIAPPSEITQFFGLYALSGKMTAFLAPLAVGALTALAASQRAGMFPILAFLGAGFVLMLRVTDRATEQRRSA
ncbi:MAG: MFS transporter [Pseudomonadota bacterium]|nr:MFS transporter [Pseudomonadota bacterium]